MSSDFHLTITSQTNNEGYQIRVGYSRNGPVVERSKTLNENRPLSYGVPFGPPQYRITMYYVGKKVAGGTVEQIIMRGYCSPLVVIDGKKHTIFETRSPQPFKE
jgi:hypothetical protein